MSNSRITLAAAAALLLAAPAGAAQDPHGGHVAPTLHGEAAAHEAAHGAAEHGDPIAASRPGLAEYTGVLDRSVVQLEAGYSLTRVREENSHSIGEALVRYGLGARSELRVGLNSYAVRSDHGHEVSGLQDASVGLKSALLRGHGWIPSAAVVVRTSVPTGSDEIGSEGWEPASGLSLGWTLPHHVSLLGAVDYVSRYDHGERAGELTAAAEIGFALSEALHAHAEYAAIAPSDHWDERLHHVSGGVGYHLTHDLQLDVWGGHASHHGESEILFGLGFSRRWK